MAKPEILTDIEELNSKVDSFNPVLKHSINYFIGDELAAGVGVGSFIAPMNLSITGVKLSCKTAPTGASIIIDINKNGASIYTTQANRPSIAQGTTSSTAVLPDTISITDGDIITLDIDQVGSTVKGESLTISIRCTEV